MHSTGRGDVTLVAWPVARTARDCLRFAPTNAGVLRRHGTLHGTAGAKDYVPYRPVAQARWRRAVAIRTPLHT
jgi:hypothetical protein